MLYNAIFFEQLGLLNSHTSCNSSNSCGVQCPEPRDVDGKSHNRRKCDWVLLHSPRSHCSEHLPALFGNFSLPGLSAEREHCDVTGTI